MAGLWLRSSPVSTARTDIAAETANLQISHRLGLSKKIVLDKTPPADAAVRPL
jgi:hypothetical protein